MPHDLVNLGWYIHTQYVKWVFLFFLLVIRTICEMSVFVLFACHSNNMWNECFCSLLLVIPRSSSALSHERYCSFSWKVIFKLLCLENRLKAELTQQKLRSCLSSTISNITYIITWIFQNTDNYVKTFFIQN
jgi:hypothetical protein